MKAPTGYRREVMLVMQRRVEARSVAARGCLSESSEAARQEGKDTAGMK